MSKTVHISSPSEFSSLLSSSRVVVVDCKCHMRLPHLELPPILWALMRNGFVVYADWCGPCKAIAPLYEQLSAQLSRPKILTFTKVDTDKQKEIAESYSVTA